MFFPSLFCQLTQDFIDEKIQYLHLSLSQTPVSNLAEFAHISGQMHAYYDMKYKAFPSEEQEPHYREAWQHMPPQK